MDLDAPPPSDSTEFGPLKFRNYYPRDENLRQLRRPAVPDFTQELTEHFDQLAAVTSDEALISAPPKKANWDLKRDLEPKLDELDRETQRAIYDMLKTKLARQDGATS